MRLLIFFFSPMKESFKGVASTNCLNLSFAKLIFKKCYQTKEQFSTKLRSMLKRSVLRTASHEPFF